MNKSLYYLSMSVIIAGILVGLYYMYLYVYPFKMIVENNQPSPVLTKEVNSGGAIIVTKDYCKYTKITATLVRTLVDGVVIQLPEVSSNLPTGCHKVDVIIQIPEYIPTGTYRLKTTSLYKMNTGRVIPVDSITEEFKVIGKPN